MKRRNTGGFGGYNKLPWRTGRRGEVARKEIGYTPDNSERDRVVARALANRELNTPNLERDPLYNLDNPDLPFSNKREEFGDAVEASSFTILSGETGSGKSTQAWKELVKRGYDVIVLVPRRNIADNLYDRALEELELLGHGDLGKKIAAKRHSTSTITPQHHGEPAETEPRVTFMTAGTYMRMAKNFEYTHGNRPLAVISDEIHEANFEMEIATALAAEQVSRIASWRMILSSATHDLEPIQKVFTPLNNLVEVPHIEVQGRPFNVEMHESSEDDLASIYIKEGIKHDKSLLFTSGKQEIEDVEKAIYRRLKESGSTEKVIVRHLHAKMPTAEMEHIHDPVPPGHKLVIIATPFAQSGITLPNLTFVASDGTIKRSELVEENADSLIRRLASRAEIKQQAGRCGRDVDGGEFYLVRPVGEGEEFISTDSVDRDDHAPAEIYNRNLSRMVLTLANLDMSFEYLNERFLIHKVKPSSIYNATEALYRLGALNGEGGITPLGKRMDQYTLRPELARIAEAARENGAGRRVLGYLAIILAAVEVGGLQYYSRDAQDRYMEFKNDYTTDDWWLQYDIAQGVGLTTNEPMSEADMFHRYDIDVRNAGQVRKYIGKIATQFNVGYNTWSTLGSPTVDERQAVLDACVAGMIDMTYRQAGKEHRGVTKYQNIIEGPSGRVVRELSGRSILPAGLPLIMGFPRQYTARERRRDEEGNITRQDTVHDIVEMATPISEEKLIPYVEHLTQVVNATPIVHNGQVMLQGERMYGDISFGNALVPQRNKLDEKSRRVLVNYCVNHLHEAPVIHEIFRHKKQIEHLARIAHPSIRKKYLVKAEIEWSQDNLVALLYRLSEYSTSVHEMNAAAQEYCYRNNFTMDAYIREELQYDISVNSPEEMMHDGRCIQIKYSQGRAFTTDDIGGKVLVLPDGREVYEDMKVVKRRSGSHPHTPTATP